LGIFSDYVVILVNNTKQFLKIVLLFSFCVWESYEIFTALLELYKFPC